MHYSPAKVKEVVIWKSLSDKLFWKLCAVQRPELYTFEFWKKIFQKWFLSWTNQSSIKTTKTFTAVKVKFSVTLVNCWNLKYITNCLNISQIASGKKTIVLII